MKLALTHEQVQMSPGHLQQCRGHGVPAHPLPLAGEGGAAEPRRERALALLLFVPLAACAATQAGDAVAPAAPGFLLGLWHGLIFPLAWVASLFMPKVAVYAVPNNGGWYDFGYFLGIVVFGVGAKRSHTVVRDRVVYRDRGPVIDSTATRVD